MIPVTVKGLPEVTYWANIAVVALWRETLRMATNTLELTNVAAKDGQLLGRESRPFGQLLRFPAGANELPLPSGERYGLGCAVAVRLVLVAEFLAALTAYGVWRMLH